MISYDKKGKTTTQKLLDQVNYSIKEKYGFNPISVLDLIPDEKLEEFLQEKYVGNLEELMDDIKLYLNEVVNNGLTELEDKYNRIPQSIDSLNIPRELRDYIDDTSIVKTVVENGGLATARGGGFAKTYNYSTFNPALADFLIKMYFKPGSTIADPFCGRVTRALIANKNGVNYHGWDVSQLTLDINKAKIADVSLSQHEFYNSNSTVDYFNSDGTKLVEAQSNFYDGILTCPPYFNIEKYTNDPGQLSSYKKYEDFLVPYSDAFKRFFDIIKPTKDAMNNFHPLVIVTGNFRVNNEMVDFTGDTRKAARDAGFTLYDEIHHKNNSPFVYLRGRQNEARHMVSKVHETVSVFIKKDPRVKKI